MMVAYITKRLVYVGFILVLISMLVFRITQVLPGNVANVIAGQFAPPDVVRAIEAKLGLNDPIVVQYWRWASKMLRGDLGDSLIMERPISPIVGEAIQRSAVLALISFFFIAVVGIGLGVLAAIRHNRPIDHAVSTFTYLGISVPEFFWGLVLILVFARTLQWLPTGGYAPIDKGLWPWLRHLIMPAATLTFAFIAHVSRLTRSSMLETMQSHFVRTARAKGLPERLVILRHALRNGLLSVVTVFGLEFGSLLGGAVVTESVFNWPGIGTLLLTGIKQRDYAMVQGTVLFVSLLFIVTNLIVDLSYGLLDPRIRA